MSDEQKPKCLHLVKRSCPFCPELFCVNCDEDHIEGHREE